MDIPSGEQKRGRGKMNQSCGWLSIRDGLVLVHIRGAFFSFYVASSGTLNHI